MNNNIRYESSLSKVRFDDDSMEKYSEIKEKIGINYKNKLMKILEKYNFIKDVDYIITKDKNDQSFKPITEIYLNKETYRYLLLMADTNEGNEYRRSCINISNYEKIFDIKIEEEKGKSKYNKEAYKKYYERNKEKILEKKRKQYKQI
jgi:hypothetical protein